MSFRRFIIPLLAVIIALATACGSSRVLHIETDPEGAEVYLQRRGEYEISASVSGIGGTFDGDSFEDDFYFLGTTPLDYEFDLSDSEGSFSIPGVPAGASVTKHFREGVIRIVMNGYRTEERTVQFSNNDLNLILSLDAETSGGDGGSGEREPRDGGSERTLRD
jgi:hypothetical protein